MSTTHTSHAALPNFFILGAGRCGTTSLAQQLGRHRQVFIPKMKEPSFFSASWQWIKNPADYAQLYAEADVATALGDASHIYLEDPSSPETIKAFVPEAKFVLMFRNPADRALAMYSMMLEHGYETHRTFEAALGAEDERFESDRFRRTCAHSFWNYMYFRSGLFGEQVSRYLELWPRDRFYATTLYEYIDDTDRVTSEITDFLELETADLGDLPHSGSSKGTRSVAAQYLERRLLRPLERRNVPLVKKGREDLIKWNRDAPKPSFADGTRDQLIERFRPDLALLHELLGVDVEAQEQARAT